MTEGRETVDGLVRYHRRAGVAHLVLARPDRANAVDLPTARALGAAVDRATADPEVRAVLVRGEGRRFCAGGDVEAMAAAPDRAAYLRELAGTLDGALRRLADMPKPVVVAVQGAAAGAGLALVLSCDVAVVATSAKFLTAYASVGLTPDCGLSHLLPRAVGQPRALELALTGRTLSAAEALAWGMISEVADDARLEDRARHLAEVLAAGPVFALGQTKRLVRRSAETSREEAGREETRVIASAVTEPESAALLAAFTVRGQSRPGRSAVGVHASGPGD
ncbi:enoyl-CoA hydratase/isomerase family protein [Streptomyces atratus]|uniref:enoyl-CoA hydratase/isomerase family protein n=1 Tax=Streptomyces atratus TaxID=1893 RepID=UPI0033CF496A